MRQQLLGELDYVAEARWLERFARAFAGDPTIVIPRVDSARSTARVLTMERLDGRAIADLAEDDAEARRRGARAIFRFAFGAPLQHGIFNADPHPGNYLILAGEKVGFVDFGSAAALSDELRDVERRLFLSMIQRDGETLRHAAHEEGLVADAAVFEGSIWREWEEALARPFLTRGEFTLSPKHVAPPDRAHRRALARCVASRCRRARSSCGASASARSQSSPRCHRASTSAACSPSFSTTAETRCRSTIAGAEARRDLTRVPDPAGGSDTSVRSGWRI